RLRTRRCRENRLCSTQFLKLLRRFCRFAVDVYVGSELLCETLVFRPASDGCNFVPELRRKLDSQVAQAADALYRNQVAGKRTAVPQRIEGGHSGTEQR